MNKLNNMLGASILSIAALYTASCRSFEQIQGWKAAEESVVYNPNDPYTSIGDMINEASRYNLEDTQGKELSDIVLIHLKSIKDRILSYDHGLVQKRVQNLGKVLQSYHHPFSALLENQRKDLSYVVVYTIARKTNSIKFKGGSTPTGAAAAGGGAAAGVGAVGYGISSGTAATASAGTAAAGGALAGLGIIGVMVGGIPITLTIIELPYNTYKSIFGEGEDNPVGWSWPKSFLYVGKNNKIIRKAIRYYPSKNEEIVEEEVEVNE